MTGDECRGQFPIMVGKLNAWDLTPRAKAVALEIARESFGEGRMEVELWQREIAVLTGYNEQRVCDAIDELEALGVLQRRGRRGGTRVFRLLANATMVEPERRLDEEAARGVRAAVRMRNAQRCAGDDPGAVPLLLRTNEEELRADLARASAESAAQAEARERAELHAKCAASMRDAELAGSASRGRNLLDQQVAEGGNLPVQQVGTLRAGARDVYVKRPTEDVLRDDVVGATGGNGAARCGGGDADHAFEQVRALLPSREFAQWERKWRKRCREEPAVMLEAIGDAKIYAQRNKVQSMGAVIFRRAAALCRDAGRTLHLW